MPRVEFDVETTMRADQVRGALIDFSDRRPAIWPDLAPEMYEVHEVGETSALVKEGSTKPMAIWALERYDWSEPNSVRWTVESSSFCAPGSRVIATLGSHEAGGTTVHVDWKRTGSTFKGKAICALIALTRGAPVRSSMRQALRALEGAAAP